MPTKVMISSVRKGLSDVRDAIDPVLKIMGHEVIRFETRVKTQPAPPRAVCVEMVEESDVYLLLLGDEYGDPMPATDQAPTEEEWSVATKRGKPTVAFKRSGGAPTSQQAAFIRRVEDYETGVWRYNFASTADLLRQLGDAMAVATEALRPPAPSPLATVVHVPWLERSRFRASGDTVLETHVVPLAATTPLPAAGLADLGRRLAVAGQEAGLFALERGIDVDPDESGVIVQARPDGRAPAAGFRALRSRGVSIWEGLRTTGYTGVLLDEPALVDQVARDLRLAVATGVLEGDRVAVAAGFEDISMLGVPAELGTGVTLPYAGRGEHHAHPDPTRAWPLKSLAIGADEIAREVVAALLLRLDSGR
jgi:hypothetical protein